MKIGLSKSVHVLNMEQSMKKYTLTESHTFSFYDMVVLVDNVIESKKIKVRDN